MTLEKVAQQAMDYLDSVGVAAEYEIVYMHVRIITDEHIFTCAYDDSFPVFMSDISYIYPQKSPA
ncbi:hypothetical protein [Pseudoalteromonas phage C7]|jgi:hypothetical protein|uniref:hypothetical protein n=1 Tax=Pseudoalteromonas phage C7 TaxID=2510494 RepID=UPI00101737AE|nr:hypothetical protein PP587_gp29 [Pseudoalteromonas phage C7]QAY17983.1 hypothetical protein [Pseudoalteromonas phage C7]